MCGNEDVAKSATKPRLRAATFPPGAFSTPIRSPHACVPEEIAAVCAASRTIRKVRWRAHASPCEEQSMVPRGLEPRTLRLLAVRSSQLSYETSWALLLCLAYNLCHCVRLSASPRTQALLQSCPPTSYANLRAPPLFRKGGEPSFPSPPSLPGPFSPHPPPTQSLITTPIAPPPPT